MGELYEAPPAPVLWSTDKRVLEPRTYQPPTGTVTTMADTFFPYRFDRRFVAMWLPFGARPGHDGVHVGDGRFRATFGFLRLDTSLANLAGGHITEGYRWWTAIGARQSFADDGLTFGTNQDRGVCVHFHDPVRTAVSLRPHSALTVTVEDCAGLVAVIGLDEPAS